MTSDFVKLSIKCLCFLRLNRSFVFGRESLPLYLYSYFEKLLLFQMSFLCICQGGITCGAIDEPRKSSKAIDERVIINFRDKNVYR